VSRGLLLGALIVVALLAILIYASSASARRLRDEGAFGSPVATD
jgi:uncharacterized membrane protein YhaH (DUF805 family)